MTAVALPTRARLDIGKVFEQTFSVYAENFVPLILASLVLVALPQLVVGLVQMNQFSALNTALTTGAVPRVTPPRFGALGGLLAIVSALFSLLFQGGVNRFTSQILDGGKPNMVEDIRGATGVLLAMIGVAILMGLGVAGATILLIVPGVMLALAWSVALPVAAIESVGVTKALGRSLELTRGRRWSIFLLGLIVYVVIIVLALVMFGVTGGFVRGMFNPVRLLVLQPILGCLLTPLSAVGLAALYHQLRESRDGAGKDRTAAIFD